MDSNAAVTAAVSAAAQSLVSPTSANRPGALPMTVINSSNSACMCGGSPPIVASTRVMCAASAADLAVASAGSNVPSTACATAVNSAWPEGVKRPALLPG